MTRRLPKRYYVSAQGMLNRIIADAFSNASEHKELSAKKNKKMCTISFAWELTPSEITQLKKSSQDAGIPFDAQVWVKCGDHDTRPAREEEWNKFYKRRFTKKKKISGAIKKFIHSIP